MSRLVVLGFLRLTTGHPFRVEAIHLRPDRDITVGNYVTVEPYT